MRRAIYKYYEEHDYLDSILERNGIELTTKADNQDIYSVFKVVVVINLR